MFFVVRISLCCGDLRSQWICVHVSIALLPYINMKEAGNTFPYCPERIIFVFQTYLFLLYCWLHINSSADVFFFLNQITGTFMRQAPKKKNNNTNSQTAEIKSAAFENVNNHQSTAWDTCPTPSVFWLVCCFEINFNELLFVSKSKPDLRQSF